METYNWMVKFTPQTVWIERKGILLWLAFFFIELGAGMFFVASFFNSTLAMAVGWLVCAVLGGGLHLLFLGKPVRFWRMMFSSGWRTSWISRGLIFVSLFLVLGAINIILNFMAGTPAALLIAVDIFAFLTVIYGGFAMNYVNGIPLWNTALLPVLYIVSGLWGGAEVTLGINLAGGQIAIGEAIESWIRVLLIGFVVLIPVYLMSVRYTSTTGQASVRSIVKGKWANLFWAVVVVVGMIVPLIVVFFSFSMGLERVSPFIFYVAILGGLIGDLTTRYLILRCGMYNPLIPTSNL
jgi:sulfite dehydrogenase (quinone) subunit SoeC